MSVKKINISGNEYDIKDANAQAMISDEFDSGTSYTTGDYCIYENVLYKFTSNKSAGAWDSGKVAATNIDTELSSLNSSCLKVRVAKMLNTGAWMDPNTVKAIDIDVLHQDGDICVAFNSNNTGASNLIYTPCVDNGKWLVTVNANSKGGGPDTFRVIILNT